MTMRRGFKTEANATATEVRAEIGLAPVEPLDPHRLANHLAVPVVALSTLDPVANLGVHHLLCIEPESFSAVTVFRGSHRKIVHNDQHVPGRQNSNIAHELSHALLLHDPTPALDDTGCRLWNQDHEEEANWLAGTLLIPAAAAIRIARNRWTVEDAADRYGVSPQMVQWRLNMTGAARRSNQTRPRPV